MKSLISLASVAAISNGRSCLGASVTRGDEAVPRDRARAMAAVRPHNPAMQCKPAAPHFGTGIVQACQVKSAWQQHNKRSFSHTTRYATADGGALGPHPARDPV